MKVRIAGVNGLCDAALIRQGTSNDPIARVRVPGLYGRWGERFFGPDEFRQTCQRIEWTAKHRDGKPWDELAELMQLRFVD